MSDNNVRSELSNGYEPVQTCDGDDDAMNGHNCARLKDHDETSKKTCVVDENDAEAQKHRPQRASNVSIRFRLFQFLSIVTLILFIVSMLLLILVIFNGKNTLQEGYETKQTTETRTYKPITHHITGFVRCSIEMALERKCQYGYCEISPVTFDTHCVCDDGYDGNDCELLDPHQLNNKL